MKVDRPSKNLMTTLPRTASQTTTSARCRVRSLPSTLPSNRSVDASSSSVARWIRASPLPFSSPIERSATRGVANAEHALREDRAHVRVLDEVLGRRVRVGADVEQDERAVVRDHLDGEGRSVDARQAAEAQDRGGHAGAGVTRGDDRVRLAAPDEVHGDQDRGVLLLAQGEGRMLVHADDLGRGHDRDVGGQVRRDPTDDGLVTDQDDLVGGVAQRMIDGAGDDLGWAVIPAHRVDGEAHSGGTVGAPLSVRGGHLVSVRRRRRRPA